MKATITRRVDECTFQCGYEMRRCTACGKSARTVPVLLSLECGAELMGFVCKTCVHAADLEDTRPHVHVGPEAQIVPSTSHKHLVMEIARMTTRMAHTSWDPVDGRVVIHAAEFPVRLCNFNGAANREPARTPDNTGS